MDWFNELTAKLPRRNDAEPPGLREQIVAELRDHLECDFRREMITASDEQAAWQRVHNKFGNPAEVALRLWLDAMKGKLIMQKLSLAFSAVLACICFAMVGLVWNMMDTQAEMQKQTLAQIQNLIASFPEKENQNDNTKYSGDWRDLSIKLIPDNKVDGEGADKIFGVNVYSTSASPKYQTVFQMKPGETHQLGMMPPGDYSVTVTSPWDEQFNKQLFLGPGRISELEIIVPVKEYKEVDIDFQLILPEGMKLEKEDRLWTRFLFETKPRQVKDAAWGFNHSLLIVKFDHKGNVVEVLENDTQSSSKYHSIKSLIDGHLKYRRGIYTLTAFCVEAKVSDNSIHSPKLQPSKFSGVHKFAVTDRLVKRFQANSFFSASHLFYSSGMGSDSNWPVAPTFFLQDKQTGKVTISIPEEMKFDRNVEGNFSNPTCPLYFDHGQSMIFMNGSGGGGFGGGGGFF